MHFTLARISKGARVHKRAARNAAGRGESPPAPSREEASAFACKEAAEGDITAFNAEVHKKTALRRIPTRKGQDKTAFVFWLDSWVAGQDLHGAIGLRSSQIQF